MSFYTDVLKKNPKFNSTEVMKDMSLLEPGTREAVTKLIALAKDAGYDIRVLETFRSQARQQQVFKAGASKLSKVGCHGYGLACDFGLFINGKYEPNGLKYTFLVDMCKKVGMISGIDWGHPGKKNTFVDSGHVQRIPVFRQNAVFSGAWYPPVDYDPYKDMKDNGY